MLKNTVKTLLTLLVATGLSLLINLLGVGNESIIMLLLLGVLLTAVLTSSRLWAIFAAAVLGMLFNFLFTEPRYTFRIYSTTDLMLLGFFLVTAIISGSITSRLQAQMELASQNERTARTLYRIASAFLSESGRDGVRDLAVALVREHTGLDADVELLPDKRGDACGYDIEGAAGTLGRIVFPAAPPSGQQVLIVQAICTQLGIALEREKLVAEREEIRLAMERERQRATLLRSIAHDLRTPLTALGGAGSLLADNYHALTDSERCKLAADVSEEIVWLSDLVENILNMTRISEGQLLLQKGFEVIDDIVGEAVKHTERLLRGRRVRVSLPEQVVAVAMDGKLIAQVVINLFENAARHTPPDSDIVLNAWTDGGLLYVSVADTGDGVPDAIRGRLFERFVTQDGGIADGRRGLGLGLAICKTVVEAHGGEIWHEDNRPHGSVFTFTLPLEVQE